MQLVQRSQSGRAQGGSLLKNKARIFKYARAGLNSSG